MIINWVTTKAQQFLPEQDAGLDELNVSFDFALSSEIMDLLYAQNDDCMGAEAVDGDCIHAEAVAEASHPAEDADATAVIRFELDEYELALT
ncbi:MAG TPA: hypothetical protein VIF10_16895 [Methylobacter sp.]|jgi:hypothetical protein